MTDDTLQRAADLLRAQEQSIEWERGPYDLEETEAYQLADRLELLDATPNDDLRELIEKWRGKVDELILPRSGPTDEGVAIRKCADQLEKLIDDE